MMLGRPAVHVSCATLSPPASLSLVNVTVALWVPAAAVGGEQRTGAFSVPLVTVNGWVKVQLLPPLHPAVLPNVKKPPPPLIVALVTVSTPRDTVAVFVMATFAAPVVPS